MKVQLYYRWTDLDKEYNFYIDYDKKEPIYLWLWFYLGKLIKERNFRLYPWKPGPWHNAKIYKQYNLSDAQKTATLIVNAINKKVKS